MPERLMRAANSAGRMDSSSLNCGPLRILLHAGRQHDRQLQEASRLRQDQRIAFHLIERNGFSLDRLAAQAGLSKFYFNRLVWWSTRSSADLSGVNRESDFF